jgi:hypothetical protein
MALERAIQEQHAFEYGDEKSKQRLLPRQVTLLIKGVDVALARMEKILK